MRSGANGDGPATVPGDVPLVRDYDEVGEAWRCPHTSTDTGGPGDEHFRAGTVVRLDGKAHRTRRRAMGRLLSRGGHKYFRDTALFPTADSTIREIQSSGDPDGWSRVDLVPLSRRVNQQLAAALVGFDKGTSPEGAADLQALLADWIAGKQGAFDNTFAEFDVEAEASRKSLAAAEAIRERFYGPAYERRLRLLEQLEQGQVAEDALPSDLLMLMAQRADPAWEDEGLRQREALFVLGAGVRTTSFILVWALEELFVWLAAHPEDRELVTEDDFLLSAANEALRLHPVVPGFVRRATEDVTLQKGTHVDRGQLLVIENGPAGAEPSVFGHDAETFNPHREVPRGTPGYAYAFGAGPHLCYGAPLVTGAEGLDGSLVYLLKALFRAGVEPDPEKPRIQLEGTRGVFDSGGDQFCHVRFPTEET